MVDRYSLVQMKVQNFRAFGDVDIDFEKRNEPRKRMTFLGHQGSGKSTLILAIQWCAYGTEFHNPNQMLSRSNLYPDIWGGVHKEPITVILKFRDTNNLSESGKDITCKRMLFPESSKDEIQVLVGNKISDKYESHEFFDQIFGSQPSIKDGVMWVVRSSEMLRMAQTISSARESDSYFLNFMNLNVPLEALIELKDKYTKAISRLLPKGKGNIQKRKQNKETIIRAQRSKIDRIRDELEGLSIDLVEIKPSKSDEIMVDSGEMFKQEKNAKDLYKSELEGQKISSSELPELMNTLMAGVLIKKGINIPKTFGGSEFEWDRIAQHLEQTELFNPRIIEKIRSLGTGNEYDTGFLLEGKKNINKWRIRIKEIKRLTGLYNEKEASVRSYNNRGITEESIQIAMANNTEAKRIRSLINQKNQDLIIFEDELFEFQNDLDLINAEISKSADNKLRLNEFKRKESVVSALIESIKKSNKEYESIMFDNMIEKVKSYWKRIDQIGTYSPVLIQEEPKQFALERISDGSIRRIKIDDDAGTASGGESQLLLVCTCLAVSSTSGAKMPIILDDCFTEVDKDSRKALVDVVAEDFQNMIFVTNDPDKARLLDSSEGVLCLSFPESLQPSINQSNIHKWRRWKEVGDLNG